MDDNASVPPSHRNQAYGTSSGYFRKSAAVDRGDIRLGPSSFGMEAGTAPLESYNAQTNYWLDCEWRVLDAITVISRQSVEPNQSQGAVTW